MGRRKEKLSEKTRDKKVKKEKNENKGSLKTR